MTTAHLNELTAQQVRAAADTRSATVAAEGVDTAVRSTHGIIASATAGAVSAVVAVRRSAGQRYDQSDDAMGRALDGQVPG
ncbi:type VII secretion target [Mycolicibacterium tusciae]|uniref:type VII secretion target n=1 Tax=Mycolicibacterium tusciae TaxID=75922 RepID=UPI0003063AA6|nr:type VII secretion target [Mycolicibacterium tusciae]